MNNRNNEEKRAYLKEQVLQCHDELMNLLRDIIIVEDHQVGDININVNDAYQDIMQACLKLEAINHLIRKPVIPDFVYHQVSRNFPNLADNNQIKSEAKAIRDDDERGMPSGIFSPAAKSELRNTIREDVLNMIEQSVHAYKILPEKIDLFPHYAAPVKKKEPRETHERDLQIIAAELRSLANQTIQNIHLLPFSTNQKNEFRQQLELVNTNLQTIYKKYQLDSPQELVEKGMYLASIKNQFNHIMLQEINALKTETLKNLNLMTNHPLSQDEENRDRLIRMAQCNLQIDLAMKTFDENNFTSTTLAAKLNCLLQLNLEAKNIEEEYRQTLFQKNNHLLKNETDMMNAVRTTCSEEEAKTFETMWKTLKKLHTATKDLPLDKVIDQYHEAENFFKTIEKFIIEIYAEDINLQHTLMLQLENIEKNRLPLLEAILSEYPEDMQFDSLKDKQSTHLETVKTKLAELKHILAKEETNYLELDPVRSDLIKISTECEANINLIATQSIVQKELKHLEDLKRMYAKNEAWTESISAFNAGLEELYINNDSQMNKKIQAYIISGMIHTLDEFLAANSQPNSVYQDHLLGFYDPELKEMRADYRSALAENPEYQEMMDKLRKIELPLSPIQYTARTLTDADITSSHTSFDHDQGSALPETNLLTSAGKTDAAYRQTALTADAAKILEAANKVNVSEQQALTTEAAKILQATEKMAHTHHQAFTTDASMIPTKNLVQPLRELHLFMQPYEGTGIHKVMNAAMKTKLLTLTKKVVDNTDTDHPLHEKIKTLYHDLQDAHAPAAFDTDYNKAKVAVRNFENFTNQFVGAKQKGITPLVTSANDLAARAEMNMHSLAPHAIAALPSILTNSVELRAEIDLIIAKKNASPPEIINELKAASNTLTLTIDNIRAQKEVASVITYASNPKYILLDAATPAENLQKAQQALRVEIASATGNAEITSEKTISLDGRLNGAEFRVDTHAQYKYEQHESGSSLFTKSSPHFVDVVSGVGTINNKYTSLLAFPDDIHKLNEEELLVMAGVIVNGFLSKLPQNNNPLKKRIFEADKNYPPELIRAIIAYSRLAFENPPEFNTTKTRMKPYSADKQKKYEKKMEALLRDPKVIERITGSADVVLSVKQQMEQKKKKEITLQKLSGQTSPFKKKV